MSFVLPREEPVEEEKPQIELGRLANASFCFIVLCIRWGRGVTDDLFAPGRRRRAAPKPAKKAAPAMSEETPEEAAPSEWLGLQRWPQLAAACGSLLGPRPEPDAEAKPRVSAWQRLKDWMLVHRAKESHCGNRHFSCLFEMPQCMNATESGHHDKACQLPCQEGL